VKTEVKPGAENEVVLAVEVEKDDVQRRYERTLSRLRGELQLPGFRKGHVPRQLVLQHLGEDYVRGETLNDALPEWYDQALTEASVDAVSMPDLDLDDFDPQGPFTFRATVQVRPTPTLGQYKGLEVPKGSPEVTDAQILAQLTMLQERFATLQPVEGRAIAKGDFVLMDLEGSRNGEPIEGAQANDYMAEVGRGQLIPGFEEALEGVMHGEEKIFDVTFPDDYQAEELQGQPATFKVKVKEIKEKVVPALDDQFAADASEFETIAELRDDIRRRMMAAAEASVEHDFRAAAVEAAVANATVTIPPAMVEREAHHLYHELEESVGERGLSMEVYLGVLEKTPEEVEKELAPRAEALVKRRLVLDAIVAAEGLEVSDDDLRERIKQDAELLGRDPNQLVLDVYKSGRQDMLRDEMLMAKAVSFVADNAVAVPAGEAGDEEAEEAGEPAPERPAEPADAAPAAD
jgi:trigger factor